MELNMEQYKLYCLRHPETLEIRYVGVTKNILERRLKQHMKKSELAPNTPKTAWIKSLLEIGLKPVIELIESCGTQEEVFKAEIESIKRHRILGYRLTNSCSGGRGVLNPHQETKNKIGLANKGRVASGATREKISRALKGRLITEVHKDRISKAKTGQNRHESTEEMSCVQHRIQIIDQYGNAYPGIKAAARVLGLSHSCIGRVLKGRYKHTQGYIFTYYKKEEHEKK
jgi:hypothetical protein